jgi:3-methyladenine DNA glycosylase AlkC
MALLKDLYSRKFYEGIAVCMTETIPGFNTPEFLKLIYIPAFDDMELKARMKHTAVSLQHFMPTDFAKGVRLLEVLIESLKAHEFWQERLEMMFIPNYIEVYGLEDLQASIHGMELATQYVSCEFAIRPFLNKYPDEMFKQMLEWSRHSNDRVRRLASEGCRPRLPWGLSVPALKKDPGPILQILENLRNDPSESVRRSVANNLNDISKEHPALVIEIARKWKGESKETDAIIKHGCRTLLKQGHEEMMSDYGLDIEGIVLEELEILTPTVEIGAALQFQFKISNAGNLAKTVRLEYGLYYRKANGQLAKKVFKISERNYRSGEKVKILRNQSFKLITTRKFYIGKHELSIIINGKEMEKASFEISL